MTYDCLCGRSFTTPKGLAAHGRKCKLCIPALLFWTKVVKTPTCWNWTGAKRWDGYWRLWFAGKQTTSNRIAWELANGRELQPGEHVLHSCDNPATCRIEDARAGTDTATRRLTNSSTPTVAGGKMERADSSIYSKRGPGCA